MKLRGCGTGRLRLSTDGARWVVPADYAVGDEEEILLVRAALGSEPRVPVSGTVVTFEAHELDDAERAAWIVLATGITEDMSGPEIMVALLRGRLPIGRTPADRGRFLRISMDIVSRRRRARLGS